MVTKQQALESLDEMLVTYCDEQRAEAFNEVRSYIIEQLREETAQLRLENERLKKSLIHTAAHLAAAISLLERGGKAAKKAAPSDKMFDQMLLDYKKALSDARAALDGKEDG